MVPDCPICLAPLSSPWGSTSCGHTYHNECWDSVVAFGGGKKGNCSVCKAKVKHFSTVFMDLDVSIADYKDAEETGAQNSDINDAVDELKGEWEEVYQELSLLLQCCNDTSANRIKQTHIDRDEPQGTQDIRDICATIDLTQSPTRATATSELDSESAKGKRQQDELNVEVTQSEERQLEEPQRQQQLKQIRIQKLFSRLRQIYSTLMDLAPSNTRSPLKSKFLSLQKSNLSFQSQIDILQSEKNTLQSKLNRAEQTLFDRNLETEREKREHQDANEKYVHLMEVHESYRGRIEKQLHNLNRANSQLKKDYDQLKNVSGLADVQEMVEITDKYSKMSQRLHDVTQENHILKRRIQEKERRRGEMDRIRNEAREIVNDELNVKSSTKWNGTGKENTRSISDVSKATDPDKTVCDRSTARIDDSSFKTSSSSNRAMGILDAAPSRKSVSKMKNNTYHQQKSYNRSSHSSNRNKVRDIGKWEVDEEDEADAGYLDVQLLMKTKKNSRGNARPIGNITNPSRMQHEQTSNSAATIPIPFQRNDSVSSVSSATTKRLLKDSATLSRKSKKISSQSISAFFKPA